MLKKSKQLVDDLFENSSMSFGEHLEELRKALTKAFIWLGVGTAVGLYFGTNVVKFVEAPLRAKLSEFKIEQAKRLFYKANGAAPSVEMAKWMQTNGVVPERIFIDPKELSSPSSVPIPEVSNNAEPASEPNAEPNTEPNAEPNAEPAPAKAAEKTTEPSAQQSAINPWKNIDVARLERLQPLLLWRPIENKLLTFNVLEGFMIWLKAGLVVGAMLGSPGIFFHVWQFLAAGLYPHERRYVYWYMPLSLTLFFAGISLAFFVVFPLMLAFMLTYNLEMEIDMAPRLNEYMSLALMIPLGFGIAFQLPLVMLALHRFGIVSVEMFIKQWRMAVLVIAFLAMVLTPADVYTMLGLFFPLVGLYFFGIFLCRFMPAGRGIGSQALDPQG
jgi:sec-independent protein translocase protein TatC